MDARPNNHSSTILSKLSPYIHSNSINLFHKTDVNEGLYSASFDSSTHQLDLEDLIERKRCFDAHESIIRRSDPQKYLYLIETGSCKGYYVDNAGREHVSAFFYPSDVMGLESLFFGSFLIDILALESCSIYYLNLQKFLNFHQHSRATKEWLIKVFSEQLWHSYSMQGAFSAQELVVQFLLNLSHHAQTLGQSPTFLNLSMGRHEIGNYLGLSSETVSRIITKLKKAQLIKVERNAIILCNLKKLQLLAANNGI